MSTAPAVGVRIFTAGAATGGGGVARLAKEPGAEVPLLSGLVAEGREGKTAERDLYQKVIVKHRKIITFYKRVFVFYYLLLRQTQTAFHRFCVSQGIGK